MICEDPVMSCHRQTCVGLPDPGWQSEGYQPGAMLFCGQVRGAEQLRRAELLQMGLWQTEEHWAGAACNIKNIAKLRRRNQDSLSNAAVYCSEATNFDIRWC